MSTEAPPSELRGYLINPVDQTVATVTVASVDNCELRALYELIGTDVVEALTLDDRACLWVDENGRLRREPGPDWFAIDDMGRAHRVLGKAVLLDVEPEGDCTHSSWSIEALQMRVYFHTADGWRSAKVIADGRASACQPR